jgi:hypothetical protein
MWGLLHGTFTVITSMRANEKTYRLSLAWSVLMLVALAATPQPLPENPDQDQPIVGHSFHFRNIPPGHRHVTWLLENAFQYVEPVHGIVDPVSGYPAEGWNQEPRNGLFLRSFSQLTAIGAWIELLANVAGGAADNPYLSKEAALKGMEVALSSLLEDQRNPDLAAKGLLVNFLSLEGGKRKGPLVESVAKGRFIETFGEQQGDAAWRALLAKGWLAEQDQGRGGRIVRGAAYGREHFDGPLAPYAAEPTRSTIMGLLDQRAVTIIFGDNANLSAALARAKGALLGPEIRHDPRAAALREQIERFIEGQKAGYAHLFDPATGTFVFGWDATADRFVGWDDSRGKWVTGQMNYLINEFRGPLTFVVLRYGLPVAAIRNAGFKMKPYRYGDGRETHAPAAWDGSAFQLLGLSLFMQETRNPAWRRTLETLVDIELDFSQRNGLPGLLSEAYSGKGAEYTGLIGIPDLAVIDTPLITHAPSLYTLGVAYGIASAKVEGFLQANWPMISGLFTPHGPWEGWDTATHRIIPYQTTAHTLSLILGGLGTAEENMRRYLEEHRLLKGLDALYSPGDRSTLLAPENQARAWTSDQRPFRLSREDGGYHFASSLSGSGGLTLSLPKDRTVSLSSGTLVIRFRSRTDLQDAVIAFKRAEDDPLPPPAIPVEIFTRFKQTPGAAMEIVLPATPALSGIREVSLTFRDRGEETPVDFSLDALDFVPFASDGTAP